MFTSITELFTKLDNHEQFTEDELQAAENLIDKALKCNIDMALDNYRTGIYTAAIALDMISCNIQDLTHYEHTIPNMYLLRDKYCKYGMASLLDEMNNKRNRR